MPAFFIDTALESLSHTLAQISTHLDRYLSAGLSDAVAKFLNCSWPLPVYDILEIAPKEEVARCEVGGMGRPLDGTPPADPTTMELLVEPCSYRNGVVRTCTILLKVHFRAINYRPYIIFEHGQIACASDSFLKKERSENTAGVESTPHG